MQTDEQALLAAIGDALAAAISADTEIYWALEHGRPLTAETKQALATAAHTIAKTHWEARVEALGDRVADRVTERVSSEFKGFWDAGDIAEEIPGIIREEFHNAIRNLEQGEGT